MGGTPQGAGEWKKVPNAVANVTTARPQDVQAEMERLLAAYKPERSGKTIRDIAGYHVFFERIHSFVDGNGSVGRAIMFHECARFGLPPFIVLEEIRERYYAGPSGFDEDPARLIGYFEEMAVRFAERCGV